MAMRPTRWLATVLCVVTIGTAAGCHRSEIYTTNSYYMARNSSADATALGCYSSGKAGWMTLFFGSPTSVNGVAGATVWGAPNLDVNAIGQSVIDFVKGYAYCRPDSSYRLLIGIGTSNSLADSQADAWLYNHGQAWATMVRNVAGVVNANWPSAAQIFGAYDFEPNWSSPWKAHHWMSGYNATPGRPSLFANASADGCPTQTANNGPCDNGWNQGWVWHLGWEIDAALPFPQIYATSGVQARQWQLVDLWATTAAGDGMFFFGTMSQFGACQQTGGCPGADNTAHEAWDFLMSWLGSDPRTQQDVIDGMTDLRWNT